MHRPIGVIDSGVGGLTVMHELMRQLPKEKLIYVGDTLRCPYGSRNAEEVKQFTFEMVHFLLEKDIKMIVVACNTATAFALEALQEALSIPVVGVIQPGARAAIKVTKNNDIGIIGTEGTVKSDAYADALHKIKNNVTVHSLACPSFVPMVEKGVLSGEEALENVSRTLQPLKDKRLDTLILGCTHYPLIENTIQTVMGEHVTLISSSEETARETSTILSVHELLNSKSGRRNHQFFTTGDLAVFNEIALTIFQREMTHLKTISIEKIVLP